MPRTKKDRTFRKELRQVLDRHDWTKDPKKARHARSLLDALKYRSASLGDVTGWYILCRLREEGFARRILVPKKI